MRKFPIQFLKYFVEIHNYDYLQIITTHINDVKTNHKEWSLWRESILLKLSTCYDLNLEEILIEGISIFVVDTPFPKLRLYSLSFPTIFLSEIIEIYFLEVEFFAGQEFLELFPVFSLISKIRFEIYLLNSHFFFSK